MANYRLFSSQLRFIDEVVGMKTAYYVYEAKNKYVLMSFSSATSGNFNIVDKGAVEQLLKLFSGKKSVTRKMVDEHPRMQKVLIGSFDALQLLYVVAAMGQATIIRNKGRALLFNIKKSR